MRYDFACDRCEVIYEKSCPIAERDQQCCDVCGDPLYRQFQPAQVMLPERFTKWSLRNLEPTYAECQEIDRRNEEYLRQPKPKPGPTFDQVLTAECEARRIDPRKVQQYKAKDVAKTL